MNFQYAPDHPVPQGSWVWIPSPADDDLVDPPMFPPTPQTNMMMFPDTTSWMFSLWDNLTPPPSGRVGAAMSSFESMSMTSPSSSSSSASSSSQGTSSPSAAATTALSSPDEFCQVAFPSLDMFTPPSVSPSSLAVPVDTLAPTVEPAGLPCPRCGKEFATRKKLRNHEHTHTHPYECVICHRGYSEKKRLRDHYSNDHPEDAAVVGIPRSKLPCPVAGCPYEGRRDNLKRHIRTKHR